MAVPDLEKIVKIIFAGDDTNLGKTITSVGGGLDTLGKKVGDATQPFADLSDTIIKIDAVLAGLAVGALVVATRAAGEFGDSFNEIKTLIDPTTLSMEEYRDQILGYAKDSTQSIAQITAGLYSGISAGEDYRSSLALLEQAEKLGIATKSSLNTAIEALRPTLSAFGLDTKSAADFADILFQAVKNGKLTLDELAPVLGNVASIAKNAGVPFDDLAAAIAALTASAGIGASEAVTQLKGAILAIVAPTDTARAAAKKLEVGIGQEAIAAKGLDGVLRDLYEATGGNTEQLKKIIPRVEALNAVLVLGEDAAGIFSKALGAMEERAGTASIAYDKMAQNFELVNQRLINNIQAALIEVGEPLLDDWGKLALSIVNILRGVEDDPINWGDVFGPLTGLAEELLSDLAGYFNEIAVALPDALDGIDWTGFTGAIRDLVETGKTLFGELLGGLDLTKAEDLEAAIQKVVDTFENWVDLTSGLVQGLAPFLIKIAELASKFSELDEKTLKSAGEFIGWGKSINTIANQIPNLTGSLDLLSGAIGLLSITRIPAAVTALGGFGGAATLLAGAGGAMPLLLAGATALAGGWYIGSKIGKDIPILGEAGTAFGNLAFAIANLGDDTVESMEGQAAHTAELAKAAVEMVKTKEAAGELASQIEKMPAVAIDLALDEFFGDIDFVSEKLDELSSDKVVGPAVDLDLTVFFADVDTVSETLDEMDADLTKRINLDLDEFFGDIDAAEEKLNKDLPAQKLIEIKLQGEIDIELAKIKTQAETLQTFFEWEAKVEIAEIEAQIRELEIGAELVGKAWETTAEVISAALGALDSDLSGARWKDVLNIIDREQDIREDLAEQMIKLQEAQIRLLDARAKALAEGKGVIQITTDGIEPELEQVLYSIIQKAQVKANEEGFNALLGI